MRLGEDRTSTLDDGSYRFSNLPIGLYTLHFDGYAIHFDGATHYGTLEGLRVSAGSVLHVNPTLEEISIPSGMTSAMYFDRDPDIDWSSLARRKHRIVIPAGSFSLGGSVSAILASTGDPSHLVGLGGSYGLEDRVELAASAALLATPSRLADEFFIQSASMSGRIALTRRYAAWARASGGPTLGSHGKWISLAIRLEAKKSLGGSFEFHGQLGPNVVGLFRDGAGGEKLELRDPASFTEATIGADLAYVWQKGMSHHLGIWIGAHLHIPVIELRESTLMPIDPQIRNSFRFGAAFPFENWDWTWTVSVIDRGSEANAETTLPILVGGFDQVMLSIGVRRRFKHRWSRVRPTVVHGEGPAHLAGSS